MQKINILKSQKPNFKGQEINKKEDESKEILPKETTNLNGAESLASQGKAYVNMQISNQESTSSLKDAKDALCKALEECSSEHQSYLKRFLELAKDDDETREIEKLNVLTKLCKNNYIQPSSIEKIFNRVQWDSEDHNMTKKQSQFLCKLSDKKLYGHDIKNIFDTIQWNKDSSLIGKQITTAEKLLDKSYEAYSISVILNTIQWDKGDDVIENQISLIDNLLNKQIEEDYVLAVFTLFYWDQYETQGKNQASILNELFELCKNPNDAAHIFSLVYCDNGSQTEIDKRINIIKELLSPHEDSDKIWPKYEDTILLLENWFSDSSNEDINYNEETDKIVQNVIKKMSLEDTDEEVKNNIKSILTKSLKNPRQFLDGIPHSHTETETKIINDKGKTKSFYKIGDDELPDMIKNEYKKRIASFFIANSEQIVKAFDFMDKDAFQTILDKRLTKSKENLNILTNDLTPWNADFIKELIEKNDKYKITINGQEQIKPIDGSGFKKVELANMIVALQKLYSNDVSQYFSVTKKDDEKINLSEDGVIDFDKISDAIQKMILKKFKVSTQELQYISNENKFNGKYIHTLAHLDANETNIDLIRAASYGKFDSYIEDTNNKYGKANHDTKNIFKERGLSFDQWSEPNIDDISFDVKDKKMKIKLWDRNPYEDLFVGNKTSCCTAIGQENGAYTPLYLLNKAFNVIELYNDKNEVVGMSRVYMADINGKPSLIMDNIELNSNYGDGKISSEETVKIRNNFFKYANEYAKKVTGNNDAQVYFSKAFTNVPVDDLNMENADVSFVGKMSDNIVYLNILGSAANIDKTMLANLYKVPKETEM